MTQSILYIEDCVELHVPVSRMLTDFDVRAVATLSEAERTLEQNPPDLLLLDIDLPDGNGLKFMARLQADPMLKDIPVMFVTGQCNTDEKLVAFSLGADDYITKPFDTRELRARITNKLRKARERQHTRHLVKGDLQFNQEFMRVFRKASEGNVQLDLTVMEYRLLLYFAKHEGHVVSRTKMMEELWGGGVNLLDRTIDTHVSKLRKKIAGSTHTIESVYGAGYRFNRAV